MKATTKPIEDFINTIIHGDALSELNRLPGKSIHTIVTSPPYWTLRSYHGIPKTEWPEVTYTLWGVATITVPPMTCELGHEKDPMHFVGHLVLIFRHAWRVLRDDGTLWINLGDSYVATGKNRTRTQASARSTLQGGLSTQLASLKQQSKKTGNLKFKAMVGIPWLLAYALRDDGWYLRSDIIWSKTAAMPESVTDRPTKSHEYVFLLAKSERYFYDYVAIKTPAKESSIARMNQDIENQNGSTRAYGGKRHNGPMHPSGLKALPDGQKNIRELRDKQRGHSRRHAGFNDRWDKMTHEEQTSMGANKRSVWTISPQPFTDAHFAVFPEDLVTDPIKAGTSEYGCCSECGAPYARVATKELIPTKKAVKTAVIDRRDEEADPQDQGCNRQKDGHKNGYINKHTTKGWAPTCSCGYADIVPCRVLDMFSGSGTTFLVANKLGRHAIGIELSKEYVPLSHKRIGKELGLFNPLNNGKA